MSEKQELIIFTGNIGSGKSLMASKLAKKGYVVVNNDAITTMVHGGEYGMYNHGMKNVYRETEMAVIETALEGGLSVVVDRTCMKKSDRERYIAFGKIYDTNIISYDWGPGNGRAFKRRLLMPKGITAEQWTKVYYGMKKSYEKPFLDEGFSMVVSQGLASQTHRFYAFDFDGTIVKQEFPGIGAIIPQTVNKMMDLWENDYNIIIIWTCRSGDYLNQMKAFLIKEEIPFDFINENPLVDFGSPKIFAHEYYDDRNCN